jgi:hypothetical protein
MMEARAVPFYCPYVVRLVALVAPTPEIAR